jgi:hypothetical protein
MTSSVLGQIGALNIESYCVRVLSCANNGAHRREHRKGARDPRTSDEELEMLVIVAHISMNREFMTFVRTHYKHLTHDHFGHTVVDPEDATDE